MIEIKNITLELGAKAVISGFSATFVPGTISGIIGENGVGKSTLIAALAGDLPTVKGAILLNEKEISDYSLTELAKVRSVVMQNSTYQLPFTVSEILALNPNAEINQSLYSAVVEGLEIVQLLPRKVTTLSGGEKQRVAIAFALLSDTKILLLDEPLSAQAEVSKVRIINILKDLSAAGKTIILVAHLPKSELTWCDQIIDNLG